MAKQKDTIKWKITSTTGGVFDKPELRFRYNLSLWNKKQDWYDNMNLLILPTKKIIYLETDGSYYDSHYKGYWYAKRRRMRKFEADIKPLI